jgi:hypothetical protein
VGSNLPANASGAAHLPCSQESYRDASEGSPIEFDPYTGPPDYIYVKLAEHVAGLIRAGVLRPGARLLSEAEFATRYRVSIGTVRRAVRVLASRGLVRTIAAKGTYVWGPVDDE